MCYFWYFFKYICKNLKCQLNSCNLKSFISDELYISGHNVKSCAKMHEYNAKNMIYTKHAGEINYVWIETFFHKNFVIHRFFDGRSVTCLGSTISLDCVCQNYQDHLLKEIYCSISHHSNFILSFFAIRIVNYHPLKLPVRWINTIEVWPVLQKQLITAV